MNERASTQPAIREATDLEIARFYALGAYGTRGIFEWLGTPGSTMPASPDELVLAAKDTEAYLLSRPASPRYIPKSDAHFESIAPKGPETKTARQLVDEWAEADLLADRTRVSDIFEVLADRATRRAALPRRRRTADRRADAAYTLNTLYDRKERLKRPRTEQPSEPEVHTPEAVPERHEPEPVPPPARPPQQSRRVRPVRPAVPPEPEIVEPAVPEPKPVLPSSTKHRKGSAHPFLAAGAAVGAYFAHPEKGRRRQAVAVLVGYVAVGAVAWALGHPPNQQDSAPPTDQLPEPPSVAPEPAPAPPITPPLIDNLQPQNYEGQAYEWGAVADEVGPAAATPELLSMIEDARGQGIEVDVWGDVSSGHWGINDITVEFPDGSSKTYYDTPQKLAILDYFADRQWLIDTGVIKES